MISVTVRHIIMALPLFVVSTVGRELWNEISKQLVTTRLTKWYQLQSRHIIMAFPLFVVTTVGRALWNEISKQLFTTRLTKYSKTAFAI
jgi:hypothetical protein